MADVVQLLQPGRVLTLTGVGGSGKTRIAQRVIADSTERYPVGVWVAQLADLTDAGLVADVIANTVDVRLGPDHQDRSALAGFFADHPGLLVLDNCEHLADRVADLVTEILQAAPELTVLTTSQLPLGVTREVTYQVPPLAAPGHGQPLGMDEAGDYEAVALFVQRATESLSSFRLNDENVAAVGALVTHLDGLPLAIELAAARVRLLSPDVLLEKVSRSFSVLRSDVRDRPTRHRSLTAAVGWTYELCSPSERELWRRLSVFTGGFELEAAETVCAGSSIEAADVLGLLSTLTDLSVVGRVGETGARYRMLETIRQFGSERLDESETSSTWRDQHLQWYSELAVRLEQTWTGPDQLAWMDTLRAEHPNLRAALEYALSSRATALAALQLAHRLEPWWICTGLLSEARRWLERAIALTGGATEDKVNGLRLCAWFGALQMDLGYARLQAEEAARLAQDASGLVLGHHLFASGVVASWEQDLEAGIAFLLESEAAYERAGHLPGVIAARLNSGIAYVFAGDYDSAGSVHGSCLEMTDRLGDSFIGGYARWSLGLGALMGGDLDRANTLERVALTQSSALGDHLAMALQLETMAWLAAMQKDAERAALLVGGAGSLWRRIGMPIDRTPYIRDLHGVGEAQARELVSEESFDRLVARGMTMALPDVVDLALAGLHPSSTGSPNGPLSRRETEVAALVADGLTNRDIAERLFLSERTVEGHVQSALRKLGFSSRTRIATWFQEQSTRRAVPSQKTVGSTSSSS
ncbi:MAG TPA: LuxR C-terminal-related transcriptional regulator [Marmoricola sp.]|nr:LuxR C-terminal-related transcriptional regulator [Marmoricola sp.]